MDFTNSPINIFFLFQDLIQNTTLNLSFIIHISLVFSYLWQLICLVFYNLEIPEEYWPIVPYIVPSLGWSDVFSCSDYIFVEFFFGGGGEYYRDSVSQSYNTMLRVHQIHLTSLVMSIFIICLIRYILQIIVVSLGYLGHILFSSPLLITLCPIFAIELFLFALVNMLSRISLIILVHMCVYVCVHEVVCLHALKYAIYNVKFYG